MRAIYRELWAKTTAEFKGSVLVDVLERIFVAAGCTESPFCLGVGNKPADALAYQMANVKSSRILLVQKNSEIRIVFRPNVDHDLGGTARGNVADDEVATRDLVFCNYADPSLMEYVYHKLAACGLDRRNESVLSRHSHVSVSRSCDISDDERAEMDSGIPLRNNGPSLSSHHPMPIQSVPAAITVGAAEVTRDLSPERTVEEMPCLPLRGWWWWWWWWWKWGQ